MSRWRRVLAAGRAAGHAHDSCVAALGESRGLPTLMPARWHQGCEGSSGSSGPRKIPDDGKNLGDFVREAQKANGGRPIFDPKPLPGVKHVIAVASGKGGVGKSTVAVNIAVGLAQRGLRVGLIDADVHGPSVPLMMGLPPGTRLPADDQGRVVPLEAHGVRCVSVGLMVAPERAAVWRGPMVSSALDLMSRRADWGGSEVVVVDLPPGTGDVQLTLAQKVALSGAVVVSTPQAVAVADVVRGVDMFSRVGVPVLGVVENMSWVECAGCGREEPVFGRGGGERAAADLGLPFLGSVPLRADVREWADRGRPALVADPGGSVSVALRAVCDRLASTLGL